MIAANKIKFFAISANLIETKQTANIALKDIWNYKMVIVKVFIIFENEIKNLF